MQRPGEGTERLTQIGDNNPDLREGAFVMILGVVSFLEMYLEIHAL